jgi:penicillin-binding protein 1A
MSRTRTLARLVAAALAGAAFLTVVLGMLLPLLPQPDPPMRLAAQKLPAMTPLAARSVVLAADGSTLAVLYDQDRVPVKLSEIPNIVVEAVVATEDKSFFRHAGVDPRSILRASMHNGRTGDVEQGGSTITQQLVKNTFLTSKRTVDRKVREVELAVQLEKKLGKDAILERYLNTIYLGEGSYGVGAAAERYFGKKVGALTLPEAALLAGLISNPNGYDPFTHPDQASARRLHALERLKAEHYIDDAAVRGAAAVPLPSRPTFSSAADQGYFVEEVKRRLLDDRRLGPTPEDRYATLYRGGLTVRTTLDPAMQRQAEAAVRSILPTGPFTGSLVSIDPSNGAVRALVGGPGLDHLRFNLATQGARQAGSTFKPIALAAAIADGHSPEDVVDGSTPCKLDIPGASKPWDVENYEGEAGGVVTLRDATIHSVNCAYARLSLAIGPEKIAVMAHRLGVTHHLDPVPSIPLGTQPVSPLEMASVYATFAAEGVHHDPIFINEVRSAEGKVLLKAEPHPSQAVSPQVARTVTDVLQGVIAGGTGTAAAIGRPAAGKTGTASEWRDAWFCGFTPTLATAVWMGAPDAEVPMTAVPGVGKVTGATFPARIWSAFMGPATESAGPVGFTAPDGAQWPAPTKIGELPPGAVVPGQPVALPAPVPAPAPPPPPKPAPAPSGGGGKHPHH